MMRAKVFFDAKGFRDTLIAGEEPELCVRIRDTGWKIWRLANEMTMHDANMTRFTQWWKRSMRAGYTYAEGSYLLGRDCHKERNRALLWGILIPLITILFVATWGAIGFSLLAVYPLQIVRLTLFGRYKLSDNFINGLFRTIGKFAETFGGLKFYFHHLFRIESELIEYK